MILLNYYGINTPYLHVANLLNVSDDPPATLKANTPVINVTIRLDPSVSEYIPLAFKRVNTETNMWLTTTYAVFACLELSTESKNITLQKVCSNIINNV